MPDTLTPGANAATVHRLAGFSLEWLLILGARHGVNVLALKGESYDEADARHMSYRPILAAKLRHALRGITLSPEDDQFNDPEDAHLEAEFDARMSAEAADADASRYDA